MLGICGHARGRLAALEGQVGVGVARGACRAHRGVSGAAAGVLGGLVDFVVHVRRDIAGRRC